ncbi:MAG: glucuronate isomerase [Caldilineae bacterium]|nr:glucuronate isomerase [Caldilineae bacterium]
MKKTPWTLDPERFFDPDPAQRRIARTLYDSVAGLPLVCPHGHVDLRLFSDPDFRFGNPAELLIIPDHYVTRMLYSQGVPLEALGVPRLDGGPVETDPRQIWQTFADNFYLFRGTPSGAWLAAELVDLFGVREKLNSDTAQAVYDQIEDCLARPEYRPRPLFDRFNIEVLCTTDPATDTLPHHRAIRESGWHGVILPTFRPDAVVNLDTAGWRGNIDLLSEVSGVEVVSYASFVQALEQRRGYFKELGAPATDHAAVLADTEPLDDDEAEAIFARALAGRMLPGDPQRFTAHMLSEMARMSVEDGLVMQLHVGSMRNHNDIVFQRFGLDKGCDIPRTSDFVYGLRPLLNRYGNDPRLRLILFTLDETTYARELAPLAGHYPAVRLGPPWWFHDSLNGIARYLDQMTETAGLQNLAGFNDDTRAYPSIPARHDLWRRACANWVAGLIVRGIVDEEDAAAMVHDLAYGLAKRAYRLG